MNMHNFDSGSGVEDIIREELGHLLPNRYSIRAGEVVDPNGNTAGDCDLVICNDFWVPLVKSGVTPTSRKVFMPIDGVFAVGEIKQTLNCETLDAAMKKLVKLHRLQRSPSNPFRPTENREGTPCHHGLSNPLYSMIIATKLEEGTTAKEIIERFFLINKTLKRLEVVRALCILGHETVTWGFKVDNQVSHALFQLGDLYLPIYLVHHNLDVMNSVLYPLVADLFLNLNQMILATESIASHYGFREDRVVDVNEEPLNVDVEWLSKKEEECFVHKPNFRPIF